MALKIYYQDQESQLVSIVDLRNKSSRIYKIVCVEADKEELTYIKEKFLDKYKGQLTIPMVWSNDTMRWYGDIAKTIVANL